MRECRNCGATLAPKNQNLACLKCQSAYLDMRFLKTYFRENDFQKLIDESKKLNSKSSHNCLLCKKQLALHFIGKDIQVESCYPCQKIWFDPEEIKKFQTYTQKRNDGKTLYFESYTSNMPMTDMVVDQTNDHSTFLTRPSRLMVGRMGVGEIMTNLALNKITDTHFFKKYPLITFILVVIFLVIYFKK